VSIALRPQDDPLFGLTFQFQPIVAADGKRLLAYETLVRRTQQDGTIAGPATILPELMRPERIEAFTRSSLEFALARLEADTYLPALSVNLSPRQAELAVTRRIVTSASQSARRRLMIELTEDPIVDHPTLPKRLDELAELGVRIFLDDIASCFRQRFSLLNGAVHGLKLDRSLLSTLLEDPIPASAAELLGAATEQGLLLVAEGVEDIDVLPALAARGISFFQGFALGEPWSDPRIARRRIVSPRSSAIMPEPELITGFSLRSPSHN
jgi:EAL domain-containing protein (putative c-di-GMP-specific phosphodiesterase class I)